MRSLILNFLILFSLSCGVIAQERTDSVLPSCDDGNDLTVSVLTCAPGPDVYELCGHAALRIRNAEMDSVWNYGIFDFSSPNFIYRFCKGETDYMVRGYEFRRFMPAYVMRGSKVSEQVLALTQEEARKLRSLLQTEALPQNRVYRYNYVRDNCATRPWKRVTQATERQIVLPDTSLFRTFRDEMSFFHRNYPWYQFGIDCVLGSGLDYTLPNGEDAFAPPVLEWKLAHATIDGTPLVKETNVIFTGYYDATLPPTPLFLTPMAAALAMLLLSFGTLFALLRYGRYMRIWISTYFLIAGLAGCVVAFLVFFSSHEATSPNWLLVWLNPVQLLLAVGVWFRSWRRIVYALAWYDSVMPLLLAIMWIFLPQVANPAVWPMFFAAVPCAVAVLYYCKFGNERLSRFRICDKRKP